MPCSNLQGFRLIFAAAALLGVLPVVAADLTGTWSGTQREVLFDGETVRGKYQGTMVITQNGTNLNVRAFNIFYNGEVVNDNKRPDTHGAGTLIACNTDPFNPPYFGEFGEFKVLGDRLKATTVGGGEGQVSTFRWSFKRIDSSDPKVSNCSSSSLPQGSRTDAKTTSATTSETD